MRKNFRASGPLLFLFAAPILFYATAPLSAQSPVTVNNSGSDSSDPYSLSWAVTTLNASGMAGAITFEGSISPTLDQPLAPVSVGVTFEGGFLSITGQDDAQSQLQFQQSFTQLNGLYLYNNGVSETGLDVSVTALSWTIGDTASYTMLQGGTGAGVSTTGGVGVTGGNGGGAFVTVGSWTLGLVNYVYGGAGGSVTDSGGSNDLGGVGGTAGVSAGGFILPDVSECEIVGGAGGSVTDPTGTNQGGAGGAAWLAAPVSLSVGYSSSLDVDGGEGGAGVTGGAGGGATLASGAVSTAWLISVQAGNGGSGTAVGGAGGDALFSFTTLTQQYVSVLGGNGGSSSTLGGNGGSAWLLGGTVSLLDNSTLQVTGGNGGEGVGPGVNGGNGGDAGVSLSSFQDISNGLITIGGGNGAAGSSGLIPGNGGNGGNTSLTLGNFSVAEANQIVFVAGIGGTGGNNTGSGTGGAGGAAGSLSVTLGSLDLGTGSSLTFTGNTGGAGGSSASGTGGVGGNGGNLSFSAGTVTLSAGTNLDLAGGAGGAGGTGITVGANGTQGTVSASMGNFLNQGNFSLNSVNAVLQVSNTFDQTSGGSLHLALGGFGALSSDFVTVGGTAQVGGDLVLTAGSGLTAPARGQSVTLLTAGTLDGQFSNISDSLPGMRFLAFYTPTDLFLESINASFQDSGTTANQKAMGADLDNIALNPEMKGLMASIGALSNSAMQSAYGQLSPEDFTALYQAGFEGALARTALVDQRLSQLMDEVDSTPWLPGFSGSGTPWFAANASPDQEAAMAPSKPSPWGGFISGYSGFFNVSSDGNAAGYKVTNFGLTGAGADYRLSRQLAAGLLLGYGQTEVNLGTGGTLNATGGQLGLYGLYYSEGFYAAALAEGGINSYSSQRAAYGGTATGTTQGAQYDGALELGYQWKQDQVKVGPMASLEYSDVGMNGFTEQGSLAPLTIPSQSLYSLLSRLGVRANSRLSLDSSSFLSPALQLAWEHEFNSQSGVMEAGFGTGDSFTVAGPQIGQDGLLAGASVGLSLAKAWNLYLQYEGEFGRTNLDSNQVGGGARLGF